LRQDEGARWDAIVRLLHWALAALVLFNLVRDDGRQWHRWAGYAACAVVLARLLWSAFAARPANWRDLKPSLRATWHHVRELLRGRAPVSEGHNPLGLWMVWILWTLVLLLGASGCITRLDAFWGEEAPIAIHAWLADALLACVCIHPAAVLAMSLLQRENLPRAMITGRRRARP
jgi:cytochrome b